MPAKLLSMLSQSSLQDYTECPRRFKLRYLDQLQYPALESEPALENERNQQEGEYFHKLVQQSLLGLEDERLGKLAHSPNLGRWWQNFVEHRPNLEGYTTYCEYTLTAPLGTLRLIAKYDVIALRDDEALIVDWKTYRNRPPNERLAARWQTRVYMAVLAHSGSGLNGGQNLLPERIRMLYWFADFPTEPAIFTYGTEQLRRDWDVLLKLAEEIPSAAEYPQTEDLQKCRFCSYRSYCDRGVGAGESLDNESDTSSSERFDLNFEQIGEIAF
jgi:CRISPR/Cas system-associated exonuclease Cas4 (RecB family)